MDLPPLVLFGLVGLILVGGPIWLVGNAVQRRRGRRAEAATDHSERADTMFDSIGPLSHLEALGVVRLGLMSISTTGFITWDDMLTNVAIARRRAREWEARDVDLRSPELDEKTANTEALKSGTPTDANQNLPLGSR